VESEAAKLKSFDFRMPWSFSVEFAEKHNIHDGKLIPVQEILLNALSFFV
jgi:hypothetical protein